MFEFEPRGKIDCKNKGQLDMFYLDRIKPSLSRDQIGSMPNDAFDAECIRLFPGFALTTAQRSAAAQPALDA